MGFEAKRAMKVILPILAIAVGVGVLKFFVLTKPEPERAEARPEGVLVETMVAEATRHEVEYEARGRVVPARMVVLQPEVGGRVTWQSDELVPGGFFRTNASILKIDRRDYALALEAQSAEVNRAQLELELEHGRQAVARREWDSFGEPEGEQASAEGRALALREPHLRTATVGLQAAESSRQRAQLNLRRTTLRAPFNAMVTEESVDRGQLVTQATRLATLVGTDHFWVQVSVPIEALSSVRIGRGDDAPPNARVRAQVGGDELVHEARVTRLLPDLDAVGSMARIIVEIEDPLGLANDEDAPPQLPLLLGTYVTVHLEAHAIESAVRVPRRALHEGGKVYVMSDEGTLDVREVEVAWRLEDDVLVGAGLESGDQVVVSRIPTPIEGLRLRRAESAPEPASAQVSP